MSSQRILHRGPGWAPLWTKPTSCACSRRAAARRTPCAGTRTSCAREVNGERVSYVVNRNINYTNVCYFHCRFCAFSKGKLADHLRGRPYEVDLEEIARRTREAWERGATEMCLQGGIHPDYTGATYLDICRTVKAGGARDPRARVLAARGVAGRAHAGRDRSANSSPSCGAPGSARCPAPPPRSWTTRCAG